MRQNEFEMKKNDDNFDLFKAEMSDVEPHISDNAHIKTAFQTSYAHKVRQLAAVEVSVADRNTLTSDHVEILKSNDILAFKRDGVQHGVYKKLRMGKYQVDARLDLHKKTIEEARKDVFQFIEDCIRYELRTILILHGKGDRNPEKKALIKSYVAKWLPELNGVLAFHSAQPFHGGTGAVYVLLKKVRKI